MSRPRLRIVFLALPASLLASCGGRAAVFSGSPRAPITGADEISEYREVPQGYQVLGEVRSRCSGRTPAFGQLQAGESSRRSLSELLCSRALVGWALREKAAAVGGNALMGVHCNEYDDGGHHRVSCSARVGRGSGARPDGPAPSYTADLPELPRFRSFDEVWRIGVRFSATRDVPQRAATPIQLVSEVVDVPVQDVVLGDLSASCYDCQPEAVREALRAAVARLGGSDVVGVKCVQDGCKQLCTARAAAPEADPRVVQLAR